MQEMKYSELEDRASQAAGFDHLAQLEARARVCSEIEKMRASGEALTLNDEEMKMLSAFRALKSRLTADGYFKWRTESVKGVQIASDTNLIVHPNEEPVIVA